MKLVFRYICGLFVLVLIYNIVLTNIEKGDDGTKKYPTSSYTLRTVQVQETSPTVSKCRHYSCFDVFKCKPNKEWTIKVFLYPPYRYQTSNNTDIFEEDSFEFEAIKKAIQNSKFYTSNISEACLFLPSMDLLAERDLAIDLVSSVLVSLPSWNDGTNHLIFNFLPRLPLTGKPINFAIGKAMLLSTNLLTTNLRQGFDISIPLFNTVTVQSHKKHDMGKPRKWKIIVSQLNFSPEKQNILYEIEDTRNDVLILRKCLHSDKATLFPDQLCKDGVPFDYPAVLEETTFCLILPSMQYATTLLLDAMMMGCIPLVLMDNYVLPFHEVIDWKRAAVVLHEHQIEDVADIVADINVNEVAVKRYQAHFLWRKYFRSIKAIVLTSLEIINERVFENRKRSYEEWNGPFGYIEDGRFKAALSPPLFFPPRASAELGFTAVILTYNRVQMLFKLMKQLESVPSLVKILIVWNDPYTNPDENVWPEMLKPWKLVKSTTNRLTNRFYPFPEIETEAVMAIDDDILMLTVDEIEFAYQAWCEFPDRLVGFPARSYLTDQTINGQHLPYKYESEWLNEVSMVLTGAAFYHQIYNHWYTHKFPMEMKEFIDEKMNCEDIAMNFLVANLTGKAPIKVTPRKRFKCATCFTNDSLWSESSHFIKRSECLKVFSARFGKMPLESVEYRLDPLLFQSEVTRNEKMFPDVGAV